MIRAASLDEESIPFGMTLAGTRRFGSTASCMI